MIDADATLDVTVTCNQCKKAENVTNYPDPWDFESLSDVVERILDNFEKSGWELDDVDALCPKCVEARDNEEEPPEPYADNGGIHPMDGVGLRLFDE